MQLPPRLRFLSFNIQVGILSRSLSDYILGSWRHVMPYRGRLENLTQIAHMLRDYDVVGLQEVDAGSLRTNFINQVKFLAEKADFPHWHYQRNRNFGHFAQHSNGLLSRYKPLAVYDHKLPGLLPGRGAILALFGDSHNPLALLVLHLALSVRARREQLTYLETIVKKYKNIIIMGDMNCPLNYLLEESPLKNCNLQSIDMSHNTFPSWKPARNIDHILVSSTIQVHERKVIDQVFSDHLAVSVELSLEGFSAIL